MASNIKLRNDTSENWITYNPILLEGEIGYETDTRKCKLGNGITAWVGLIYSVDKAQLNLENVENTSDIDKVISNLTQAALDLKSDTSVVQSALDLKATILSVNSSLSTKQDLLGFTAENTANKNISNGYAGIDASGKISINLLPASLMNLHGQWDASTNTPTLTDHGAGDDVGDVYECTVAGSVDFGNGILVFFVGDWAVFGADGHWYRSPNSNDVTSVNGYTGSIILTKSDVGLSSAEDTTDLDKIISTLTQSALDLKVDKVSGKGLSVEDYTTIEKSKLSGIANSATANQADSYLLNRANHTSSQLASTISNFTAAVQAVTLDASKIDSGGVTNTEFSYLANVTSDIQGQISNKQAIGNYITELTGDVIASGAGSAVSTLSNTGVIAGAYDSITVDSKGRVLSGVVSKWVYSTMVTQANTTITYSAITELTSDLLPVGLYRFRFIGIARTAATATGIGFKIAPASATMSTAIAKWRIGQGADGTAKNFEYDQLTTATNVTSTSTVTANTNFITIGEGNFKLTASGTVSIQMRTEVAGSAATIQPDSVLIIELI